ncbi:MAG: FoF1 ATP synthase subunit gamma [Candidatus Omnitrophota bacterium]
MKTLAEVKRDLEFNKGLASLIEALKNIAVSQYRALEQKLKSYERLLEEIDGFFEFIDISRIKSPFASSHYKKQIVVAVTSDSGFLGGLNMNVVTAARAELEKIPGKLIVIGERGKIYARESKLPFTAFSGIKDEQRYAQAIQVRNYLVKTILEGRVGYLKVVYPRPISFTIQRVEIVSCLPYTPKQAQETSGHDIIVESKLNDVFGYLVYLWISQKLYEIFGLSRLAEFAARFVHLEGSSQRLGELDKKLRLQYFRIRHELVDRNMRELFSARLAFR